jgi:hypothetical protein
LTKAHVFKKVDFGENAEGTVKGLLYLPIVPYVFWSLRQGHWRGLFATMIESLSYVLHSRKEVIPLHRFFYSNQAEHLTASCNGELSNNKLNLE